MTTTTKPVKPKIIFEVYRERVILSARDGKWRWRAVSARNKKIVASSGENFDSRANALRAARGLVRLMLPGVADVVVTP